MPKTPFRGRLRESDREKGADRGPELDGQGSHWHARLEESRRGVG